jgi:hypothetical protein
MMNEPLELTLTPAPEGDQACIDALLRQEAVGPGEPDRWHGEHGKPWTGQKTVSALLLETDDFGIEWKRATPDWSYLEWRRVTSKSVPVTVVQVRNFRRVADLQYATRLLKDVTFEYCAGASASAAWGAVGTRLDYLGNGFSDGHVPLGWLCAFKGRGHDRLASRRWLEFGPWRLIREEGDLSIVQFHDLSVDDETALEQSRPGHQRMGISDTGGFIQTDFDWSNTKKLTALYDKSSQTLIRVVAGEEVSEFEMLEAAAIKFWKPVNQPVAQVAYSFIDEKQARRQLHELWLRGLEVRTFVDGHERRIDEDYHPTPTIPDWVKRLQDREGR